MKKGIFFFVAATGLLTSAAAMAQSSSGTPVTGTVTVSGFVDPRCMFTTPNATINLGEISDTAAGATAGKLKTSTIEGKTASLVGWCNGTASKMSVEAFALTGPAAGPAGFDNRVNYVATATANSVSASDTSTVAGSGAASTVGIFIGDIDVALSGASSPSSGILIAGAYNGSVVVTLSPAIQLLPPS